MRVATYLDFRSLQTFSNGKAIEFDLDYLSNDWNCNVSDIVIFDYDGISSDVRFTKIENGNLVLDLDFKNSLILESIKQSAIDRINQYATSQMTSIMIDNPTRLVSAAQSIDNLRQGMIDQVNSFTGDSDQLESLISQMLSQAEQEKQNVISG